MQYPGRRSFQVSFSMAAWREERGGGRKTEKLSVTPTVVKSSQTLVGKAARQNMCWVYKKYWCWVILMRNACLANVLTGKASWQATSSPDTLSSGSKTAERSTEAAASVLSRLRRKRPSQQRRKRAQSSILHSETSLEQMFSFSRPWHAQTILSQSEHVPSH